ncbi:Lmo0850 family protein [Bacillus sp. FJAT-49736]|uniref:Lmo0850 family protein n=1 Tax=Bacillus sp. FJAT-49736 TaxID=2833582 RepID=UPI001BCA1F3D|nr:Lmo0850 family protein [Bacillus sp. FJAT-49736]MBS4175458.1 hypothetical protein [Bacillus sp. FJAT-49736]
MRRKDHDQLKKVMANLAGIGVKITKTKSRRELFKVLEDVKLIPKYPKLHH